MAAAQDGDGQRRIFDQGAEARLAAGDGQHGLAFLFLSGAPAGQMGAAPLHPVQHGGGA